MLMPSSRNFGDNDSVDPNTVNVLIASIGLALEKTTAREETTPAEIISALFTVLYRFLHTSRQLEDPKDSQNNKEELRRVLNSFLLEFAATRH